MHIIQEEFKNNINKQIEIAKAQIDRISKREPTEPNKRIIKRLEAFIANQEKFLIYINL